MNTHTDVLNALTQLAISVAEEVAEHGDSHGDKIDWLVVISLFTNFLLLFGFLIWQAAPLVSRGLRTRRETMEKDLEEAQAKRAAAEARLGEYQEKLDNLEREIEQVVASYEREAVADQKRFQEETEKTIARMERETELTIAQETRKAEVAIRGAAVEATLRLAEEKIRSQIGSEDHKQLTEQYISNLNGRSA